jgi:hypothetical protein
MNYKGFGRKRPWPGFGWIDFRQDSRFPGKDLNPTPTIYETGVLFIQQRQMTNDGDNAFEHRSEKISSLLLH